MSIMFKNRLSDLIRQKYKTDAFRPTQELLKTMGMSARRFGCIYRKTQNPTFEELFILCEVFDFEPRQMAAKAKCDSEKPILEFNQFKNKILQKHA